MSSHTPGVTYQWEKSDDGGAWNPVGGATSASYTTGLTTYADDHDDQYRCVISAVGAASDATTNAVALGEVKNIFYYCTTIKCNCKRRCNC